MEEIKGIFIDSANKKVEVITIENTVDTFYRLLKCRIIECPWRRIAGHRMIIVCDGEFLLKKHGLENLSGICLKDKKIIERLYGNLFITKFDGIDDFTSLDDDEISDVLSHIERMAETNNPVLDYRWWC